jgi:hypothetical protein
MYIADGLMVGRRLAMEKAGAQSPVGKGYNVAFSRWMDKRLWARELDSPTRNDLFWCAEHRSQIEAWRDELDDHERAKKNHPTHMKRAYLAERRKQEAEREGADEDKPEKRSAAEIDLAQQEEMARLRADLVAEREEHGKTRRERDEAYLNPLHVWQTNAEDAAIKVFHDNRERARTMMRTFMALMPDDAAVIAAEIAASGGVKAVVEAKEEQARASRKAARAATRPRKARAKAVDKPKQAGE